MSRGTSPCLLLLALLGPPTAARAQEAPAAPTGGRVAPCRPGRAPVIVLELAGDGWAAPLADAVRALFRATVEGDGFYVCTATTLGGVRPAAAVEMRWLDAERAVEVRIEVRDDVTRKRLVRDVDLAQFPEDGRAIALAVAGDELLRASFMELALTRRSGAGPPEGAPVPAAVAGVVADEVGARGVTATLLARAGVESYAGGEVHLGGEVALTLWPLEVLGVELEVGGRAGRPERSPNGEVRAQVLLGGLALVGRLRLDRAVHVGASVGLRALAVRFDAAPAPGSVAEDGLGFALVARGTLVLAVRPAAGLELRLGAGAGVVAVGVAALDDGRRTTAVTGLELHGQLAAGWAF